MILTVSCVVRGEHLPPLVRLDRVNLRRDDGYSIGNVIYLSTFSKTLAPGLRLGWIVAPSESDRKNGTKAEAGEQIYIPRRLHRLSRAKLLTRNFMDGHIRMIRRLYGERRRDAMLAALEGSFLPR